MGAPLIVESLKGRFGAFAFGPLALEIKAGSCLALLGPSGCGKTTLLRCLAGTALPEQGSIKLDGVEISGKAPERRGVGLVSQTGDLFPHLTVRGNVEFGLRWRGLPSQEIAAKASELLSLFKLEALAKRFPAKLSGGETKKAALARALAPMPGLLLLDEPLGMLDHNGRVEMAEALKTVRRRFGITMLHVTHDRREAWTVAEDCAVMNAGAIIQSGPLRTLFRQPESRFAAEFLGAENLLPASFEGTTAKAGKLSFSLDKEAPASKGWLALRPDEIELDAPDAGGACSTPGTLKELQDFGDHLRAVFECQELDASLSVLVKASERKTLALGSTVRLSWAKEAAHPLFKD